VLSLDGNFPNPFNPMTTIKFALPARTMVELQVFDLRGRLVSNLVSREMEPGHHTVKWAGRDDSGRAVPSGAYFYRLRAQGETRTDKMLLLK
jgi:flagellar hook assembly protein FlgD